MMNRDSCKSALCRLKSVSITAITVTGLLWNCAVLSEELPISDAHLHYSHDSVEMTPPERVIEIMREANLKLALVSSSDDTGTQLLVDLAPDLIVPGLRPYTRRGETGTWFKDQGNLDYVEDLLKKNRYATIGEFHLYGKDADLAIPRRIVELAAEYNLILHAHSDSQAVERLLAQDESVKVIWAHAGFDDPEYVSSMLSKHDRLWVDLAFRGEVGSGGQLSDEWLALFKKHPSRIMLGTDTYTPERMFYIPAHAAGARVWLATLPEDIAEQIAWKNAYDLIMPVWKENSASLSTDTSNTATACNDTDSGKFMAINEQSRVALELDGSIEVGEAFSVLVTVCGDKLDTAEITLDATMPEHGHGMNYSPIHKVVSQESNFMQVQVDGVRLHMPGKWQWLVTVRNDGERTQARDEFQIN